MRSRTPSEPGVAARTPPGRADFSARVAACQARIEQVLERALSLPDPGTARLREAMRYSVLGGGKRLRPVLVYLTGEALGAAPGGPRCAGRRGGADPRLQPGPR